jgi:hypothetical protein
MGYTGGMDKASGLRVPAVRLGAAAAAALLSASCELFFLPADPNVRDLVVEYRFDRANGAVAGRWVWLDVVHSWQETHRFAVEGEFEAVGQRTGAVVRESVADLVPKGGNLYDEVPREPPPPRAFLRTDDAVAATAAVDYERRVWAPDLGFLAAYDEGGDEIRLWDGTDAAGFAVRAVGAATGQARPLADCVPVSGGWIVSAYQSGLGLVAADVDGDLAFRRAAYAATGVASSYWYPVPLASRDAAGILLAGFGSNYLGDVCEYRTVFAAPGAAAATEAAVELGPSGHRLRHRLAAADRIIALCDDRVYRIGLVAGRAVDATELTLAGFDPAAAKLGFGADGTLVAAGPAAIDEGDDPPDLRVSSYAPDGSGPSGGAALKAAPLPGGYGSLAFYRVLAVTATADQYVVLVPVHQL